MKQAPRTSGNRGDHVTDKNKRGSLKEGKPRIEAFLSREEALSSLSSPLYAHRDIGLGQAYKADVGHGKEAGNRAGTQ